MCIITWHKFTLKKIYELWSKKGLNTVNKIRELSSIYKKTFFDSLEVVPFWSDKF